jgi:hypothetical protein
MTYLSHVIPGLLVPEYQTDSHLPPERAVFGGSGKSGGELLGHHLATVGIIFEPCFAKAKEMVASKKIIPHPTMDIDSSPSPSPRVGRAGAAGPTVLSPPLSSSSVLSPPRSSSSNSNKIKIHPLAIIGISDHHTRVICGGSALPPESPVVGLLFGYYSNASSSPSSSFPMQRRSVTIVDSEEMEYPNIHVTTTTTTSSSSISLNNDNDESNRRIRAAILQKIELHQKVFPQHQVVGWYRVARGGSSSSSSPVLRKPFHENEINDGMNVDGGGQQRQQPTEEDLIITQTEMTRYCYCKSGNSDGGGGGGGGAFSNSPLFVLMDASKANEDFGMKKKSTTTTGGESGETTTTPTFATALEELESGDELPLTVYETFTTAAAAVNTVVFVNAEFELETYEPERIAVERVFKTQPPSRMASSSLTSISTSSSSMAAVGAGGETPSGINRKTGKKSKKDTDIQDQNQQQHLSSSTNKPAFTRGPTELDTQLTSLQSSICAMNLRISVLLEYLQKVERGEIPVEDTLLRSIDGLVHQLPLVIAALEERSADASPLALDGRTPLCGLENEYSNAMLLSYLACTAKTARAVHVFCEKFRIVCENRKSDPRRPLY